MRTAEIKTEKGTMKVEFYENDAPNTVDNFCKLAKEGFYNGLRFHRVILIANLTATTNTTTEVYYLWLTPDEIPEALNFSFATAVPTLHT